VPWKYQDDPVKSIDRKMSPFVIQIKGLLGEPANAEQPPRAGRQKPVLAGGAPRGGGWREERGSSRTEHHHNLGTSYYYLPEEDHPRLPQHIQLVQHASMRKI
jgi:hypothetical protein